MSNSPTGYYYSTSTSTSATYEYGGDAILSKSKKEAVIIRTRPPAQEWSDVVEVCFGDYNFSVGDIVKTESESDVRFGRIESFKPTTVELATAYANRKFYYYEIRPIKNGDVPDVKPNPNHAFLTKRGDR